MDFDEYNLFDYSYRLLKRFDGIPLSKIDHGMIQSFINHYLEAKAEIKLMQEFLKVKDK